MSTQISLKTLPCQTSIKRQNPQSTARLVSVYRLE
jgi:hypothetical protein